MKNSQDVIAWLDMVSGGIAKSKRVLRPRIKDWDRRRNPVRYKWNKAPVRGTV